MDTFPLFVYQALAELPPKQAQLLRALAEEDRTLFYETMLKLRKHQRIQESGNIQAWKALKQEIEETLSTIDL